MSAEFDHVAILVRSVSGTLKRLRRYGWPVGDIEEFPSEGTKEAYVGPPAALGRLLLLEPIGDGPYRDAMAKRGPGAHHIAINVGNLAAFAAGLQNSGWYFHTQSPMTLAEHDTIWLARPGVPLLVEVAQRSSVATAENVDFVSRIEVPVPARKPTMVTALGADQVHLSPDRNVYLTIEGHRRSVEELLNVHGG